MENLSRTKSLENSMDDASAWIYEWTQLVNATHSQLEERCGCEIDRDELKAVAVALLGAESEIMLVYQVLPTADELVELLSADAQAGRLAGPLQEIRLDESLIPLELLSRVDEQTIKSGGEIWRIHKSDADSFPSNPHAHNIQTGLKLHLGTGELFKKTVSKGRLPCKSLRKLRGLVRPDIKLPDDTCN
jgi:hypothetical protein